MTESKVSKTVMVTGAFGQVGKRCVEVLLSRGHMVVAVDLQNTKTESVAKSLQATSTVKTQLTTAFIDLLDQTSVNALFRQHSPEIIIHLAAICSPTCYLNPELGTRVNVGATAGLLEAALREGNHPVFIYASSSAVYGSCNPFSRPHGINGNTPANPIECYGRDKMLSEQAITDSGLDYAILRLAGVISPDGLDNMREEYLLLARATPGDNRVHAIDARDAALAFANTVELERSKLKRVFLVGGNDSYKKTQREIEDDVMEAIGIGRLGESASLPGDPDNDLGWSFTDWFDTRETQAALQFQKHDWTETSQWVAGGVPYIARCSIRLISPLLRVLLRRRLRAQNKKDGLGEYANIWALISRTYGEKVLVKSVGPLLQHHSKI